MIIMCRNTFLFSTTLTKHQKLFFFFKILLKKSFQSLCQAYSLEHSQFNRSGFRIMKKRQYGTFFFHSMNVTQRLFFSLPYWFWKQTCNSEASWLLTAGKLIFLSSCRYIHLSSVHFSQQVPDQWLHALNSFASRHLVNATQTIKGAAGMTTAWKIPHMERWKTTCGFLSAEASSAARQWEWVRE